MDQFEDEQFDEKNDENKFNANNQKITLLYDETTHNNVCKVGHNIGLNYQKHLSIEPCIMCGHRNNNTQNKPKPDANEILQFLNNYKTNQIPFGPNEKQHRMITSFVTKGLSTKWPLHYAAISGDTLKIRELCKNKNIEIDQKMTVWGDVKPLTTAAEYGQLESVIELVKHGANPMSPPDQANQTPYRNAALANHKAILVFFNKYVKYLYNFDVSNNTNVECYYCYNWDFNFNKPLINGTMAKYIYCKNCTTENVKHINKTQANNKIIERRIIKTIKENASISVDTLCQMKDVISLHTILKEIMVSGKSHSFSLWLLDIDNFKAINTHLTHAIADTKIQALGEVLKRLEPITNKQWRNNGYSGIVKVWAFRQGGDEFALVVWCNYQKKDILQKFYETLRSNISKIKLGNMKTMTHVTVSVGVCFGYQIDNHEEMMKKADTAAETVKMDQKDGMAIYAAWTAQKIYKKFNNVPQ